jgi:hypothetical protein
MGERMEHDRTYESVNAAWDAAGLAGRNVLTTPGAAEAVGAVTAYCVSVGWPDGVPPMGPGDHDTWWRWLHVLSHCVERGGHGVAHAKLEQDLQRVALAALPSPPMGRGNAAVSTPS